MWPNPQKTADLVSFTEEMEHFIFSDMYNKDVRELILMFH